MSINGGNLGESDCYLPDDGSVTRYTYLGGQSSIEVRAWNNDLIWNYNPPEHGLWYDFYPLENGNFLLMKRKHLNFRFQSFDDCVLLKIINKP